MLVILNPSSGTLADPAVRDRLRALLPQAEFVEIAGLDAALARYAGQIVVAAGGDGTISAVAAKLSGTPRTLGVIPGGTLNHFAKDLRIPADLDEAVALLHQAPVRTVDIAEVNGRAFINNSSLGMYPQLVRQREKIQRRGVRKWAAFALAVVRTLFRWPLVRVRLDVEGRELRRITPFVFVGNNRYELEGLRMGRRDRLNSGELTLCSARDMSRWGLFRMIVRGLLGGLRTSGDLDITHPREIWVNTRRHTTVALDGEVVRMKPPLHYRIRPGALKVIAP